MILTTVIRGLRNESLPSQKSPARMVGDQVSTEVLYGLLAASAIGAVATGAVVVIKLEGLVLGNNLPPVGEPLLRHFLPQFIPRGIFVPTSTAETIGGNGLPWSFEVVRLQMSPALDLGLVFESLGITLEVLADELPAGGAFAGEFLVDVGVVGHGFCEALCGTS
jgi:hypothetical protein